MDNLISCFVIGIVELISAFRMRRNVSNLKMYKNVPDDKKHLVDTEGLKRLYFVFGLAASVPFFVCGVLSYYIGFDAYFIIVPAAVSGLLTAICVRRSYRCIPPEAEVPNNKAAIWILYSVIVTIAVVIFVVDLKQSKIEVTANSIEMEGNFDYVVPKQCLETVEIVEALPQVNNSEGGYWKFGQTFGKYRLKDDSECTFMLLDKTAPFLKMNTCNGIIYLNGKTPDATLQLAEEIRENFGDKFLNQ